MDKQDVDDTIMEGNGDEKDDATITVKSTGAKQDTDDMTTVSISGEQDIDSMSIYNNGDKQDVDNMALESNGEKRDVSNVTMEGFGEKQDANNMTTEGNDENQHANNVTMEHYGEKLDANNMTTEGNDENQHANNVTMERYGEKLDANNMTMEGYSEKQHVNMTTEGYVEKQDANNMAMEGNGEKQDADNMTTIESNGEKQDSNSVAMEDNGEEQDGDNMIMESNGKKKDADYKTMESNRENQDDGNVSKSIQVIDKKTVHRICSGQVVLDLSTAVKELVENSIDGGASNVEIRLKEYGKDLIEVSDNGHGIKECDFESVALKHYTSKLREFNDLPSVSTFGFRGEALSSLSALGDLLITTHHENTEVASKLTFDHEGKLTDCSLTAREQGTTVSIANLFHTLPVRHKEFHRNYKRDFTKLMNVLYAFCLVNRTVRISCVNQVGSRKNKLISTSGKDSMLDTISNIFGVNQIKDIIKIEQKPPAETILEEFTLTKDVFTEYAGMFLIEGYISSVRHGCGRSCTDRQFFFINKRPCDFPKLARLVNEVYHSFNVNQYPFVYLDMSLKKDYVDVNVTPDKRQIMIQQENILLVIVKSTLKHMFEQNATFYAETKQAHNLSGSQIGTPKTPGSNSSPFSKNSSVTPVASSSASNQSTLLGSQGKLFASPLDRFRSKYEKSSPIGNDLNPVKKTPEQPNLMSFFNVVTKKRKDNDFAESVAKKSALENIETDFTDDCNASSPNLNEDDFQCNNENDLGEKSENNLLNSNGNNEFENEINLEGNSLEDNIHDNIETVVTNENNNDCATSDADILIFDEVAKDFNLRENANASFDFKKVKDSYASYINQNPHKEDSSKTTSFCAKISVNENECAEAELGRNITKEMFQEMEIIGQFNLGFLITKLKNDLFIVDQHASDEKYNYETLQQTHCLKGQRLIQPLPMELSLVNKSILIDNLEIFKKNGFEFEIKEVSDDLEQSDGIQGDQDIKISLLTIPTSKNWTFSVDDVEELIYLLSDSPGVMCRPSRVHKMFASRACRKSIMVGTALNKQKMKTLVSHMGEINHPWNCPHGRPTMRHLINLNRVAEGSCAN